MAIGAIINTGTLTQTFDGEFNNGFVSSADGSTGLWRTSLMNDNRTLGSNGEEEYYSDSSVGYNPFSVQNSVLDITAQPTAVAGANALGLPYDSGVITTENSFNQLYGYFEIDAKLPAGQGLWPAFWLLPASGAWPPELDVFEVLENNPSTLYFSTHSGVEATDGTTLSVANTSSGFNLYGVMWGPQTVDLYINNVEVVSMPTPPDMDVPMYMLANLAVGGYWPGDPNSTTPFPATMQIAYVKAFAYPGTTGGTVYDTLPSQNIGAAAVAPVMSAPTSFKSTNGVATSLGGVSVAANWPGGFFTVTLSDNTGLLQTSATGDVFTSGEDTTSVTLTGNLAPINAALATLTYQGGAVGSEEVWVSATDPQGQQSLNSVVATVVAATVPSSGPVVSAPANFTVAAGATLAVSNVSVTDSQTSGTFIVVASDKTGLLQTSTATGVTEQGEGTTALTLTGTLAAINADLVSLTYQASATAGTDALSIAATDAAGNKSTSPVAVTVTAPTAVVTPIVTTPASFTLAAGTTETLGGISAADSQSTGTFTIAVSDSTGLLHTNTASGVTELGENSAALTLTGSLAAINADLVSLTYQAGAAAGTDWLWVSANAPNGTQGVSPVVVTVTTPPAAVVPVVTTPATLALSAGTTHALAGVSVADSQAGGSFTVMVSDSTGLVQTSAASGMTEQGEDTTALTLTGSLAAINADLVSLTYQASKTAGTDWLWVSANAPNGTQGVSPVVVTATLLPVVTTPATLSVPAGATHAIAGVSVADSQVGGNLTVAVSDSTGLLQTSAASGVTEQGEDTTALTLTGSLAAINADLASLTYQASKTAGTDWLWVSANDANGGQGTSPVVVTVTPLPVVTTPATLSLAAGTIHALTGVSVADSQPSGSFTIMVSDSTGLLRTNIATGMTEQGEGTTALTLTGSLAAINADLVSLTYQASATAGTDWLWVSANDAFGGQGISPVVVTVTPPPVVTAPSSLILTAGTSGTLPGVSVADSKVGGSITATVSDSTGLLHTNTASGVTERGEGTTALTLTGSLAAINADLVSLTYQASKTAGTDWLWVSANDANGGQGISPVVVTVAPASAIVISGLQTGAGLTALDGPSSIGSALQVDGGRILENTGTLVWNGGTIALGSGDPSTTNQTGTLDNVAGAVFKIEANGSVNSAGSTGSGLIINTGMIVQSGGTGDTMVFATLSNTGTVEVTTGTLSLQKAVSGGGAFVLAGAASLDFAGVVGAGSTMDFNQPGGTLEVQSSGVFGAMILGFAGGDTIDAAPVLSGVGTTLNFAENGASGTLTVSDGVHTALFDLHGSYTTSDFHMAADGHGGTGITIV